MEKYIKNHPKTDFTPEYLALFETSFKTKFLNHSVKPSDLIFTSPSYFCEPQEKIKSIHTLLAIKFPLARQYYIHGDKTMGIITIIFRRFLESFWLQKEFMFDLEKIFQKFNSYAENFQNVESLNLEINSFRLSKNWQELLSLIEEFFPKQRKKFENFTRLILRHTSRYTSKFQGELESVLYFLSHILKAKITLIFEGSLHRIKFYPSSDKCKININLLYNGNTGKIDVLYSRLETKTIDQEEYNKYVKRALDSFPIHGDLSQYIESEFNNYCCFQNKNCANTKPFVIENKVIVEHSDATISSLISLFDEANIKLKGLSLLLNEESISRIKRSLETTYKILQRPDFSLLNFKPELYSPKIIKKAKDCCQGIKTGCEMIFCDCCNYFPICIECFREQRKQVQIVSENLSFCPFCQKEWDYHKYHQIIQILNNNNKSNLLSENTELIQHSVKPNKKPFKCKSCKLDKMSGFELICEDFSFICIDCLKKQYFLGGKLIMEYCPTCKKKWPKDFLHNLNSKRVSKTHLSKVCNICNQKLDPTFLSNRCSHSYHEKCLMKYYFDVTKNLEENFQEIVCPKCPTNLEKNLIAELTKLKLGKTSSN